METKVFTLYRRVEIPTNIQHLIHPSERIICAVKSLRDISIITDKRILAIDKQGITGKKTEYFSIPYSKVITYAIETAGTFDFDSEIKLQMAGGISIELKFMKGPDMDATLFEVYHQINGYVLSHS